MTNMVVYIEVVSDMVLDTKTMTELVFYIEAVTDMVS